MFYRGYEISIDRGKKEVLLDDRNCHLVNYDFSHFDAIDDDVEEAIKEWLDEQYEEKENRKIMWKE